MKALTQLSNIVSLIGIVGLVFLFVTSGAAAEMLSMFKKETVVLCPEVSGQLSDNGKPLSDVKVTRRLFYGKEYSETVTTDAEGNFQFSRKEIRSNKPNGLFSQNERIYQQITVEHAHEAYLLWNAFPIGTGENAALSARLEKLNCDIRDTKEKHYFPSAEFPEEEHSVSSICKWNE